MDHRLRIHLNKFVYVIVIICIIVVTISCLHTYNLQGKNIEQNQDYLEYEILVRIDQQRDVYNSLSYAIDSYIREDEDSKYLEGILGGINIFVQNDLTVDMIELLYSDDELSKTLTQLLTASAHLDLEKISKFTKKELENFRDLCSDLGECCDRGQVYVSLAFFLDVEDLDSEKYKESLDYTQNLLELFGMVI